MGMGLTLAAEGLLLRFRNPAARTALSVLAMIGIFLVLLSATPLPYWVYVMWTVSAFAGLMALNREKVPGKGLGGLGGALIATTLGLCLAELPHHLAPKLTVPPDTTVYVIGDSISAGIGNKERCWPSILEEMTHLSVVNLAQAGATTDRALKQAQAIQHPASLVIVEIGGNDLLGDKDASTFETELDALLTLLRTDQHQVLVLELPLFPFRNAYGTAQRRIIIKHKSAMLPKRLFTQVLGTDHGTLDGLHLSQAGHHAMAALIADVLEKEWPIAGE